MSATIRSTVETALSNAGVPTSSYTSYINTVVAALEEREFTITETVVEQTAQRLGTSTDVVAEQVKALTDLEFRPIPEPVVEVPPLRKRPLRKLTPRVPPKAVARASALPFWKRLWLTFRKASTS